MSWDNKVVWGEGLFLQPQHFQQQDRYFDRLVRDSTMGLRPFAWGLTELSLDNDLLTLGKFAVRSAAGILPDGTPSGSPTTSIRRARSTCRTPPAMRWCTCNCRPASRAAWRPRRPS